MRGRGSGEGVAPVRFAIALLRFGGALLAVVPRLLVEARRPDPIQVRPHVLRDAPDDVRGPGAGPS